MPPMTSGRVSASTSPLPFRSRGWARNRSPRKSASVSLWRWIIVPMAPSRSRMRLASRACRRSVSHLRFGIWDLRIWALALDLGLGIRVLGFGISGLTPDAISTTNGSPVCLRADLHADVLQPGAAAGARRARRRRSRGADRRSGRAPSAGRARAGRGSSRRPPGRRMRTASTSASSGSAAWCSACESSATSTEASRSGSRARSPFFHCDVGHAPPRRPAPWRARAPSSERSMPKTVRAQRAASRASGSRRRSRCRPRRAAAAGGRARAPRPPSCGPARADARRRASRSSPSRCRSTSCSRASSSRTARSLGRRRRTAASSSAQSGAVAVGAPLVGQRGSRRSRPRALRRRGRRPSAGRDGGRRPTARRRGCRSAR